MLAPDQRDRLAEAPPVGFDQGGAMPVLLRGHIVENLGRLRIGLAQALRIGAIDPPVVLLGRDGERQDLLLAQGIEGASAEAEDAGQHGKTLFRSILIIVSNPQGQLR